MPTAALTPKQQSFIQQQKLFFVATAPRDDTGLINLSPKGLDGTLAVLDPQTVAYLDLTGSGVETIAHLRENGRICLMFCAFQGKPNILRIQGTGDVIEPTHPDYPSLSQNFPNLPGIRSIIRVHANRIADSCGFGVPLMAYQGERDELITWADKKGPDGVANYQAKKNRTSLDGLPGIAQ
ncbi:MAG: pyridoxamine 5'-phosphate oxidase family protein [Planctomycetota bacterium]